MELDLEKIIEYTLLILIAPIIQILLNKYLSPVFPKKLNLSKKKWESIYLFFYKIRFLIPTFMIVIGFVFLEFNKFFVLYISLYVGLLVWQLSVDSSSKHLNKVTKELMDFNTIVAHHIDDLEKHKKDVNGEK